MSKQRTYHVIRSVDGGWAVKRSDATKASALYGTQREAIEGARAICKSNQTELYIHGRDGRIMMRDTFGSDTRHSKG